MKTYTVYYCIKKNNSGFLCHEDIEANNKKEAFALCEEISKKKHKAHAFWKTLSAPDGMTEYGFSWQGMVFTRYWEIGNKKVLW